MNGCGSEKDVSIGNESILKPQVFPKEPQEKSPLEINRLKWKENKLNTYQFLD